VSKLLKGAAYYSIGNFTSKAINFLLLPLYTSYLSPGEYGIVNSMQVFSSVLTIFFTLGLERAIYRLFFDYKSDESQRDFLGTIAISIVVISVVVSGLLFVFDKPIGEIYESIDFYPYFAYAILTALFSVFELVPTISLQVKEKAGQYLILSLAILAFRVVPVLWQVVYVKAGAVGMLKGAMIGNIASLIILIPITLRQINIVFHFSTLQSTLKYCLPFIPMITSAWVINMSDRIFIERYFSTYEVGIYSLGYRIGQLVQFLSISILMTYNPYFYKLANSADQSAAKKKLYTLNTATIAFLLFIGFLVALFSKDIIVFFFSEQYFEAYAIIPLIVLGYIFIQLISLQSLSFYQEKQTLKIMWINIAAALINIALNFIFIPKYGYFGAAYTTLITQFIYFLIIYKYARKYYFIPYNWGLLLPTFAVFIVLTIIFLMYMPVTKVMMLLKIIGILFIVSMSTLKYKKQLSALLRQS